MLTSARAPTREAGPAPGSYLLHVGAGGRLRATWYAAPAWTLGVLVPLAAAAVWLGSWAAGIELVVVGAVAFITAQRVPDRFGVSLFAAGLASRAVAGMGIWVGSLLTGRSPHWFPDARLFDEVSQQLALYYQGLRSSMLDEGTYDIYVQPHTRAIGWVYAHLGYQPLLPVATNWVLGALAALFVLSAARRLATERSARWVGVAVAFMPSAFAWSVFNLREALIVCLIAAVVWGVPRLVAAPRWWLAGLVVGALVLLARVRFYVGLPLLWAGLATGVVGLLGRTTKRQVVFAACLGLAAVGAPWLAGGGPLGIVWLAQNGRDFEFASRKPPATQPGTAPTPVVSADPSGAVTDLGGFIQGRLVNALDARYELADYYVDGGNRTLFVDPAEARGCRELGCIPGIVARGLVYVLFAPFPWSVQTLQDALVMPELVLWYYPAVALALLGCILRLWAWRTWLFAALVLSSTAVILALIDVNVGVVVRHRAMLLPALAALAAQGAVCLPRLVRSIQRLSSGSTAS